MQPTSAQQRAIDYLDECFVNSGRPFILWYGGIRAGKTWGAADITMRHRMRNEGKLYIVGGVTVRSVFTNIAPYFKEMAKEAGVKYKESRGTLFPRMEIGENTFAIYGGEKTGSDHKVQGATAIGLILDEYELLDRMFVKQCEARISLPGALRIYTSNKDNPYNWASREYYKRAISGQLNCLLLDTPTSDNQHLDAAFLSEKISEFDDDLKRKFLDNEFVLPYTPLYRPAKEEVEPDVNPYILAIYAYGNSCVDIPFYKAHTGWVIGECTPHSQPLYTGDLRDASTYLVNSTAPLLANTLRSNGKRVRGYCADFEETRLELCQRVFDPNNSRIKVSETAEILNEHLDQYNIPGMYNKPFLCALESGIEYICRMERWSF